MKRKILALLISVALLFTVGCAGYMQKDADGNYIAPNFQDGSWSSCTYTEKNGAVTTGPPVQLGGVPLERSKPDGTSMKCVVIPKS